MSSLCCRAALVLVPPGLKLPDDLRPSDPDRDDPGPVAQVLDGIP